MKLLFILLMFLSNLTHAQTQIVELSASSTSTPQVAPMTREALFTLGSNSYQKHCAACHQVNGKGVVNASISSLHSSPIVNGSSQSFLRFVMFNQPPMQHAAWHRAMSPAAIASTLTYIRLQFPNTNKEIIQPNEVVAELSKMPPNSQRPPKIISEQDGRITKLRAEGSLASTQVVGCIPLSEVKNSFTPPDLYKGVAECIARDNYDHAADLFAIAGIFGRFDAERVADKSAGQAKTVLVMNTFSNVSQDKKTKFSRTLNKVAKSPDLLGKLCGEMLRIGMPDYYPSYMILHGIKAYTENPHDGALLKDFDSQKVWTEIQTAYLHCPS